MKSRRKLFYAFLGLVALGFLGNRTGLLRTTGHAIGEDEVGGCGGEYWAMTPAPPDRSHDAKKDAKSWTVLVYMAADNNLEKAAITDIQEMMETGSNDTLNIAVQIDRSNSQDVPSGTGQSDAALGGTNFEDARRFHVGKDKLEQIGPPLGEIDTGDPQHLRDFIAWGVKAYPADRYALIIWNHGLAWKGCCSDDESGGKLTLRGLHDGIKEGLEQAKLQEFDLLGFDACLMADLVVLEAMSPFAEYMVASAETTPFRGWKYGWLATLGKNPSVGLVDLGKEIITKSIDMTGMPNGAGRFSTLAIFDLYEVAGLVSAVKSFSDAVHQSAALIGYMNYALKWARHYGKRPDPTMHSHGIDLRHFAHLFNKQAMAKTDKWSKHYGLKWMAEECASSSENCAPFSAASDVIKAVDRTVKFGIGSGALSVYFPPKIEDVDEKFLYIPSMSGWREVLDYFYNPPPLPPDASPEVVLEELVLLASASGVTAQVGFESSLGNPIDGIGTLSQRDETGREIILTEMSAEVDFEAGKIRSRFDRDHSLLRVATGTRQERQDTERPADAQDDPAIATTGEDLEQGVDDDAQDLPPDSEPEQQPAMEQGMALPPEGADGAQDDPAMQGMGMEPGEGTPEGQEPFEENVGPDSESSGLWDPGDAPEAAQGAADDPAVATDGADLDVGDDPMDDDPMDDAPMDDAPMDDDEPGRDLDPDRRDAQPSASSPLFVKLSVDGPRISALGAFEYVPFEAADPQPVSLHYALDTESGETHSVLYLWSEAGSSELQATPGSLLYPLVKERTPEDGFRWLRASEQGLPADQPLEFRFQALEPAENMEMVLEVKSVYGPGGQRRQPFTRERMEHSDDVEDSAGDDSAGDDSAGDDSAGDDSAGDDSAGDDSVGDDSVGDDSVGDDSVGDDSVGDDSVGDDSVGDDSQDAEEQSQACAAGNYRLEGACTPCPPLKYKDSPGSGPCSSCEACPAGYHREGCGGVASGNCVPCSPGTYKAGAGTGACVSCAECPAGQSRQNCGSVSGSVSPGYCVP